MKPKNIARLLAPILFLSTIAAPTIGRTEEAATQQDDGGYVLGSIFLSILYLPIKLVTCVGTNAGAAIAYTATYGVPGNYDGGTNGRNIGEAGRRSASGDWIIRTQQLKSDYGRE